MTIQTNKLTVSVAAWGLLQLAILGVGAAGFPLWAHHPLPRESLAFQEMLCGQILVISMLFPLVTRSIWGLAINLLLMLPFDELSGLLSNAPQLEIACAGCCVALWMIGLAGWGWMLKDERRQMWVVMAAMIFSIGGVVLDYVRWEASLADGKPNPFSPWSLLPRMCVSMGFTSTFMWVEAAAPLMLLVSVVFLTTTLPIARNGSIRRA